MDDEKDIAALKARIRELEEELGVEPAPPPQHYPFERRRRLSRRGTFYLRRLDNAD